MAFKLRQPIKIDPVARYEVPFTPDNIPDGSGLVARANDNGNMIVNKNIPRNSKLRKIAESHEDNHLRAMMDGKLAYDDNSITYNGEKFPRMDIDGVDSILVDGEWKEAGDTGFPWENDANNGNE